MNQQLLQDVLSADREKLTQTASKQVPLTDDEYSGLQKANAIGEETAVAKVRSFGVWVVFACVSAILLVLTWQTINMLYAHFGEVAKDPKSVKDFLSTAKDFGLVALSTLFLGSLKNRNTGNKSN